MDTEVGYISYEEVQVSITTYIAGYYNQHRPHQFNAGLSPIRAEQEFKRTYDEIASFS